MAARRNRVAILRRGGYYPSALSSYEKGTWGFCLWTGRGMVSPCGATYFARVGKVGKAPPGTASRKTLRVFMPPPPDPRFFYGGATKGRGCIHPARAKARIPSLAPPAAALCCLNRDLLLQVPSRLDFLHRAAVQWSLRLRGWCLGQGSSYIALHLLTCSEPWAR